MITRPSLSFPLSPFSIAAMSSMSLAQGSGMSFFITSVGAGTGANLGGLAGADEHCLKLAAAAGAGSKTWRAYLSTQAQDGATATNAVIGSAGSMAERQECGDRRQS